MTLLITWGFVVLVAVYLCCSIAVITEGKYAELECGAHIELVQLMDDINSEARLNATKALGLIAETPEGREELKFALEKVSVCGSVAAGDHGGVLLPLQLEELVQCDISEMVQKAAKTSIKIITWLP